MTDTSLAVIDPSMQAVSNAPAGIVPRKRTLQLGTALMTGASIMYFAGLFGIYASTRNSHLRLQQVLEEAGERTTPWIPDSAQVELTAPTIIWWTSLLMSVVTMQWVVYSFKRNDRRHGLLALATTAMFGAAVINQVVFQWNQLGLVIDDVSGTAAASLIYTITGSHVIMICVGLVLLLFVAIRALASSDISVHTDFAASAAVFWYAMFSLYFVIWLLIFITK